MTLDDARAHARRAGERLHHLSMRYLGAVMELVSGTPISFIPQGHPGAHEVRDLVDLVMITRAEINALTRLLIDAKVLDEQKVLERFAEEYEWFATEKAQHLGVEITDTGLSIKVPPKP